jgi:carbonic anhydrase/acetyltransferase-like protein (isoleucine patch superfamily)
VSAVSPIYYMAWVYIFFNTLENTRIPSRSIVMGVPGKMVRETNDEDAKRIKNAAQDFLRLSKSHCEGEHKKVH